MKKQQAPKSEAITPELIEMYRGWTDEASANIYDARLRAIERGHAQTFTELGVILVECEARQLWKLAVMSNCQHPHSFSAWIVDCLPVSNGSAFAAYKCAKKLAAIPAGEREQIPRGNLEAMAAMSDSLAQSESIKAAAKQLKPKEFREKIEREHPNQHLEAHKPLRFSPERSARKVIDEALDMVMLCEGLPSREAALEFIAAGVVEQYRDMYNALKENHSKIGAIPATGSVQ